MTTQKIIDNIQTRLENLISERFTGTYQNIDITCSNYNPSIDSNITITITVTDQNDDPVTGFTVPLKIDGTSISGITTNSSGVATHTYTCNSWGNHKISVKSISAFINVDGWKQVTTSITNFTLYVNEAQRLAFCRTNRSINFTSVATPVTIGTIPSDYKPLAGVLLTNWNGSIQGVVNGDGTVQFKSDTTGSKTAVASAMWAF